MSDVHDNPDTNPTETISIPLTELFCEFVLPVIGGILISFIGVWLSWSPCLICLLLFPGAIAFQWLVIGLAYLAFRLTDSGESGTPESDNPKQELIPSKNPESVPIGQWIECHWHFPNHEGEPHPDDRQLLETLCRYGLTGFCIGSVGKYFVIELGKLRIRVLPARYWIRPFPPKYPIGEWVCTVKGPNVKTELSAPVRMLQWHVKRNGWLYYLELRGKRRNRWYLESELRKVSPPPKLTSA